MWILLVEMEAVPPEGVHGVVEEAGDAPEGVVLVRVGVLLVVDVGLLQRLGQQHRVLVVHVVVSHAVVHHQLLGPQVVDTEADKYDIAAD